MRMSTYLWPLALLGALITGFLLLRLPAEEGDDTPIQKYTPPRGYLCGKIAMPLVIDGRLDEAAWRAAPWTEDFVDIEGAKKPLPRFRTRAKMLWDDHYFYVGVEMDEPHVWATLTQHDSVVFHDNDFEVFIDPDGDSHEYYEFEINALNTGWDLFLPKPYKDGGSALDSWEIPGLKTAVHVNGTLNDPRDTDRGWSAEIAFPWKVLKQQAHRPAPPEEGDQWRVNFSRVEWKINTSDGKYKKVPKTPEDNWVWSPQGVINMHCPEHWGYVQFTTGAARDATFRPDPAGPARQALQAVYEAQNQFRKKEGRWARSLKELGVKPTKHSSFAAPLQLWVGEDVYEAVLPVRGGEGQENRWHIRSDARVWTD